MTSRTFCSLALAGLLASSPALGVKEPQGSWAVDVDRGRISLAAENAPIREIVLAIVKHFDLRLVEHARIGGTVSATLFDETLHAVLGQLLERHSFQLYSAAAAETDDRHQTSIPSTLWIFSSVSGRAPAGTVFLEAVLHQGTAPEKREAIRELKRLQSAASVQALSVALTDDDETIRKLALDALEDIEHPEALAAIASASHDPDPRVRSAAAAALASGDRTSAERYLELALGDPDPRVRRSVVESLVDVPLGTLPDEQIVVALNRALLDDDPEVRMHAVDALESIGGNVAYTALMRAKLDADARVAESARESLSALQR